MNFFLLLMFIFALLGPDPNSESGPTEPIESGSATLTCDVVACYVVPAELWARVGGLECVGHSFAYVAHFVFLRDVWIRTQTAAVATRRASNLTTHPPSPDLTKLSDSSNKRGAYFVYALGFINFSY